MLSGDVLRDYQKQFMSLTNAGNASTDMYEFLPLTQKYYGVDATIPVSQRKTDDACSSGQKRAPGKDQKKGTSSERSPRFVARFENSVVHRDRTQIPVSHDLQRRHTVPIVETFLPSFLTKATSTTSATLSASTNPDGKLTDFVLKDTKITERQFDPARERMLEQVLLLSGAY